MIQTKKIPQIDDLREKSGISNQFPVLIFVIVVILW